MLVLLGWYFLLAHLSHFRRLLFDFMFSFHEKGKRQNVMLKVREEMFCVSVLLPNPMVSFSTIKLDPS